METKIQKWGNSLGVRLPKAMTESQSLTAGSLVKVSAVDNKIVIEKKAIKPMTLRERVDLITPENRQTEVDWGEPRGKEIW
jgi:antitoxin MazE